MIRHAVSSLALVLILGACGHKGQPPEKLPELAALPPFQLVDHRARGFTDQNLRGRLSVASFVFTRCQTVCPLITERTKRLRGSLEDGGWNVKPASARVQLLAISVDPEHDQPEVLSQFRTRHGIAEAGAIPWLHLTGDASVLGQLVVKGFQTAVGDEQQLAEGGIEILHSSHYVLVDSNAVIRGYYRSDEEGVADLVSALESLR